MRVRPSIVVPLDGSDKDGRALTAAAAFAELADGDIELFRVVEAPVEDRSLSGRAFGPVDALHQRRSEAEQSLRDAASRLMTHSGRRVTVEISDGADVARVLVDRVTELGPDLAVLATRAAGAFGRAVRGSVADHVMRESPHPVVLVPPGASDTRGRHIRLSRVLVPLDGSALALRAIDHLLALAGTRGLEYVLVEVLTSGFVDRSKVPTWPERMSDAATPPADWGFADINRVRANAEERLRIVADRLRARGATSVSGRVVEADDAAATITRLVREELVDFIAMSTRGASGIKRFVLGSVAERVVRASEVPVLLVAPRWDDARA